MTTPTAAALSKHYDTDTYRARPTDIDSITWRAVPRTPRQPCDECGALQHQTRGASGRPQPARQRRHLDGVRDLLLCVDHSDAWHARDDYDTEPARHRRRTP